MRLIIIFTLFFIAISEIYCQNEPIIFEAEEATLGADFEVMNDEGVGYITPKTDFINSAYPGSEEKVITFSVTFPESEIYKLFARIRVGSNGANDDSFFYGNGFGTKNPTSEFDWIMCNNFNVAGYTILTDVVEETGDASTGIWKWVALSEFTGGETPLSFSVKEGALVETFQFGAREDGLQIDKIAFGKSSLYYTVENLENEQPGSATHPGRPYNGPPLATGLDKFLGCVHSRSSKRDVVEYFNQLTPGNAGKWGWVEGRRDTMVWTELDEAYQAAMDNNFVYKHHVMVWGAQQPDWIADLDSAEQIEEIEEWFAAVSKRYPEIDQVEVVNEPLHNAPDAANEGNFIDALGGKGETGWDWIINSFKLARKYFGDTTQLLINEYNIMNSTTNTDQYLEIIKLLQADSLIDGIGFQAHGFSHNTSNATILRNLDTLASTGLPLYATELDIDGLTDLQHVHNYMNLFPLLWEHPAIKGITLWGFKPAMWRGDQGCYLIDNLGNERPAMKWLRAYLKDNFIANKSIIVSSLTGATKVDRIGDTLRLMAQVFPDSSTLQKLYWKVSDKNIATVNQDGLIKAVSNGTVTVTAMSLELGSNVSDQIEITIYDPAIDTIDAIDNIAMANNIQLYPNPTNEGKFTIEGLKDIELVDIFDINGMLVSSYNTKGRFIMNFQLNVPVGLYIIKLYGGKNIYYTKIAVKQ